MLQLIYELRKNCCGRDGTGGRMEKSKAQSETPNTPKSVLVNRYFVTFKNMNSLTHFLYFTQSNRSSFIEKSPGEVNFNNFKVIPSGSLAMPLGMHCAFSPSDTEVARRFCKRSCTDHSCRASLQCACACVVSDDQLECLNSRIDHK